MIGGGRRGLQVAVWAPGCPDGDVKAFYFLSPSSLLGTSMPWHPGGEPCSLGLTWKLASSYGHDVASGMFSVAPGEGSPKGHKPGSICQSTWTVALPYTWQWSCRGAPVLSEQVWPGV